MRVLPFICLFFFLMILLPIPVNGQGEWSVNVTPSIAVNNGDNVTINVNGWPTSFVIINIGDGNSTSDVLSLVTGEDGKGTLSWSVPLTSASGTYSVVVISAGENVTQTTLEVVYDRVTYSEFLLREQQKQLDLQKGQIIIYGEYVTQVHEQIGWLMAGTVVSAIFAVVVCLFYVRFYTRWVAWNLDRQTAKRRTTDGLLRAVMMVANGDYPPDGAKFLFHPGQKKRLEIEVERGRKAKGEVPDKPYLLMPDQTAGEGYRLYPVKKDADSGKSDVPEDNEKSEAVEELKDDEEVEDLRSGREREERFTAKQEQGWFSRIFHWNRNRKVAKYVARSGRDDEEDGGYVRERPSAVARNRNRVRRPRTYAEPEEVTEEAFLEEPEEVTEEEAPELTMEQIRAQVREEILREMLEKATVKAAVPVVPKSEPVPILESTATAPGAAKRRRPAVPRPQAQNTDGTGK